MAVTLTNYKLSVQSKGTLAEVIADVGNASFALNIDYEKTLSEGTGASQINKSYADRLTILAGTSIVIDLSNAVSSLLNHTEGIKFSNVKKFIIDNLSTTSGDNLTIGDNATNPWSAPWDGDTDGKNTCAAGSILPLVSMISGFAVVENSSDLVKIDNATGNDITIAIEVTGVGT